MKYKKYIALLTALCFLSILQLKAQSSLVPSFFFDETQLAEWPGITIVNDATANNGQAMFKPAAHTSTFFFGPYATLPAGSYTVSFRMKASNNSGNNYLGVLDVVCQPVGRLQHIELKPSMFKAANEWQTLSFSINVPNGATDLECRAIDLQAGLTDLYLDYIQITPAAAKGYYSPEFTLTADGKMGLGTIYPTERLAVNGNIRAREIKVETANWPDYVFKPGYPRMSIRDTETFIRKHGHLPEVPNAAEVEQDGIHLAAMNKTLLKKVEEMTLHLIEKENDMDQLKKELADQKQLLNQTLQRLSKIENSLK